MFATLEFLDFKELGVGLAVGVLIDTTIIRGVPLPASMRLLGDWNWYLPRWLEWLPRFQSETRRGPAWRPRTGTAGADFAPCIRGWDMKRSWRAL